MTKLPTLPDLPKPAPDNVLLEELDPLTERSIGAMPDAQDFTPQGEPSPAPDPAPQADADPEPAPTPTPDADLENAPRRRWLYAVGGVALVVATVALTGRITAHGHATPAAAAPQLPDLPTLG